MAKCGFPLAKSRSYYKTGSATCGAKGRIEIVFQGKKMTVCKTHSGYHGRNKLN